MFVLLIRALVFGVHIRAPVSFETPEQFRDNTSPDRTSEPLGAKPTLPTSQLKPLICLGAHKWLDLKL